MVARLSGTKFIDGCEIDEDSFTLINEKIPGIVEFFNGTTIFITGVTGFLGHVLLHKLLSSCPGIKKIYLLLRNKENETTKDRLEQLKFFLSKMTSKKDPNQYLNMNKLAFIHGDCEQFNLGLSEDDQRIIESEVNVIFHVAATVNFNADLCTATRINVRSTKDLLNIAKSMKDLKSFVHVSTAFSHCSNDHSIDEIFYESPIPAKCLIDMTEQLCAKTIKRLTKNILGNYPNTYVFTKAVAEELYMTNNLNLPVCIFRPAIVTCTAEEPIPGWINNNYGFAGVLAALLAGLMHTLHADPEYVAHVIPCDYAINAMISSAWFIGIRKTLIQHQNMKSKIIQLINSNSNLLNDQVLIFNYSSLSSNVLQWKVMVKEHDKLMTEYPSSKAVWKYYIKLNKYKFLHNLYVFFLHLLPSYIIDWSRILVGMKPQMVKIYMKINQFGDVLSYFITNDWTISNDHVGHLWSIMSEEDRKIFKFNLKCLNWKTFLKLNLLGVREHILKDKIETLPKARNKQKIFNILSNCLKCALLLIVLLIAYFFIFKIIM